MEFSVWGTRGRSATTMPVRNSSWCVGVGRATWNSRDDAVQILDRSVAAPVAENPLPSFMSCDGRAVDWRRTPVDDAGLMMRWIAQPIAKQLGGDTTLTLSVAAQKPAPTSVTNGINPSGLRIYVAGNEIGASSPKCPGQGRAQHGKRRVRRERRRASRAESTNPQRP
jgi:hypothetical protein